jgi:carbonic anhydrase
VLTPPLLLLPFTSLQLHFVHWNCKQFASMEEASKHKHGLAVLGVFVQALEGEQNRNKHLDKIIGGLADVMDRPHGSVLLNDIRLDLKKLFPSNRWNYATYEGSLTTPPLSECVDWLVFLQPIICSSSQIDLFRQIKCPSGALKKNCRPVQPLNKRTVTIWTHHSDPVARGC